MAEPFIYCSLQVLKKDCENRSPAFYLFKRKSPVFLSIEKESIMESKRDYCGN